MSDKKNIDRLFQEKFKDFEVEPNEQIWINIEAALHKKKKRRVIPIWFKLSGIAAGLILGFFAFNSLFDTTTSVEEESIVIENNPNLKDDNSVTAPENEAVVNHENTTEKNDNNNQNKIVDSPSNLQKTSNNQDVATENNEAIVNQNKSQKNKKINSGISSEENNAVASSNSNKKQKSTGTKKSSNSFINQNQNNAVANQSQTTQKQKSALNKKGKTQNLGSALEEKNAVAVQNKQNSDNKSNLSNTNKNILSNEVTTNSIAVDQKTKAQENNIKNENFPIDGTQKKDSSAIAKSEVKEKEPNALEELLKEKEKDANTVAEAKMNRWQITSNVAPIYMSSTSNGSPIDAQFAENSKSYENNLSFGIGVNYAVNKKISVRTGVNKFTLGYNTNDVVFFAAMDHQASFTSVANSPAGSTIQVISQNNTEALRPFDNDVQSTNEGRMTQKMGYFEVPVEMSYKLIDKKFGVNLIGGLSTLFLNENEVSVSSSTMSASLGKAKNLNDIHFSTNIGVGFKYRFWKSFEANFEPMFKYQINTFNKDAGNFKPYFIGLYSGVSFNF